jgi:hypothetical protein
MIENGHNMVTKGAAGSFPADLTGKLIETDSLAQINNACRPVRGASGYETPEHPRRVPGRSGSCSRTWQEGTKRPAMFPICFPITPEAMSWAR